jgi:subtilisin family serine protease
MDATQGIPAIAIGLIDGPVALDRSDLADSAIHEIGASRQCLNSVACLHGTFIAVMLSAKRGGDSAGICQQCTLLVRPIFDESGSEDKGPPTANPDELAAAILDCIEAGARVINLSLAVVHPSKKSERLLQTALDYAMHRGVVVVAAAGNQSAVGSTIITRHPWVIPVMACDLQGRPASYSNFGRSIGTRGLAAPGQCIASADTSGPSDFFGTSIAAPYITGAIALLWSMYPGANSQEVKDSVTQPTARRTSVVPPLLNAWKAYQALARKDTGRSMS